MNTVTSFNYRAYGQSMVGQVINGSKKQYKMVRVLGAGSAGAVLEAIVDGQIVAFKMQKEMMLEERKITEIMVAQQQAFNHVIRIYDFFQLNGFFCIVMEFASGGDLYKYIKSKTPDEKEIKQIMRQICLGVQEIHNKGYMHRDLKPENIILTIQNNGDRIWKICDLGVIRQRATDVAAMTQNVGTPYYQAPEVIQSVHYGLKADIFSLGVLLYEIKTGGKLLFNGTTQQAIQQQIIRYSSNQDQIKAQLQQSLFTSKSLNDILLQMLDPDPQKRPEIDTVLSAFKVDIVLKNIEPPRNTAPPLTAYIPQTKSVIRPSPTVKDSEQEQSQKQPIPIIPSENQQLKDQLIMVNAAYDQLRIENQKSLNEIQILQQKNAENSQNYQLQYNQLVQTSQKEQKEAQFNNKRLEQQIKEMQAMKNKLEQEMTSVKVQLNQRTQQVSELQNKLKNSDQEKKQLQNEKLSFQQQYSAQSQILEKLKSELDEVKERESQSLELNRRFKKENQDYEIKTVYYKQQLESRTILKDEAIQSLQAKSDQNNYLTKLTDDLKKQMNEKMNEIDSIQKELEQEKMKNFGLNVQIKLIQQQKKDIEASLKKEILDIEQQLSKQQSTIELLQKQLEEQSRQIQNQDKASSSHSFAQQELIIDGKHDNQQNIDNNAQRVDIVGQYQDIEENKTSQLNLQMNSNNSSQEQGISVGNISGKEQLASYQQQVEIIDNQETVSLIGQDVVYNKPNDRIINDNLNLQCVGKQDDDSSLCDHLKEFILHLDYILDYLWKLQITNQHKTEFHQTVIQYLSQVFSLLQNQLNQEQIINQKFQWTLQALNGKEFQIQEILVQIKAQIEQFMKQQQQQEYPYHRIILQKVKLDKEEQKYYQYSYSSIQLDQNSYNKETMRKEQVTFSTIKKLLIDKQTQTDIEAKKSIIVPRPDVDKLYDESQKDYQQHLFK